MTDQYNPVDVETGIRTTSERIARGVKICDERYVAYLDADRAYDEAYARAFLAYEGPAYRAKFEAELATQKERKARDAADAAYRYADRRAKALENELRAWQSVNKSVLTTYGAVGGYR